MPSIQNFQAHLNFSSKKSFGLFKKLHQALAEVLAKQLTQDMNIAEIAQIIAIIESVKIKDAHLISLMIQGKKQVLSDYADKLVGFSSKDLKHLLNNGNTIINRLQPVGLSLTEDRKFVDLLIKFHDSLLGLMERNLLKANTNTFEPEYKYAYPYDTLTSSPGLRSIEERSRERIPSDSNILPDISRGVTFQNQVFSGSDEEKSAQIEDFAGDKITQEGSRAYTIFHYGNQALYGALAAEFSHATTFNNEIVAVQQCGGKINWYKDEGQLKADIKLNVFAINVDGNCAVLNTEGTDLQQLGDREEHVLNKMRTTEKSSQTYMRVPIGTIKATIGVEDNGSGYYLVVKKAAIEYNTDKLTCALDPKTSLPNLSTEA
jgi:hypothetical protein